MRDRILYILLWLALCHAALAVGSPPILSIPDGGTGGHGFHVSLQTESQLLSLNPAGLQSVHRQGFYAPGDGGGADYNISPSNCTQPDGGAQVQPTSYTGCYVIVPPQGAVDIRVWGSYSTALLASGGIDNGPFVTAAMASGLPLTCSGNYAFKTTAVLSSNTKLSSALGQCVFYFDAGNTFAHNAGLLYGSNVSNVTIREVVFDGNFANSTTYASHGIYVQGSKNFVVDHIICRNMNTRCISFDATSYAVTDTHVRFSSFDNIGNFWNAATGGVWTPESGPLSESEGAISFVNGSASANRGDSVEGNTFTRIGGDAVDAQAVTAFSFVDNFCLLDGVQWKPSTANPPGTYGVNCFYMFENSQANRSSDIKLNRNFCEGATSVCLGASADNLQIEDNDIYATGAACIDVGNSSGQNNAVFNTNTIVNNTCHDFNQAVNYEYPNPLFHGGGITLLCSSCIGGGVNNLMVSDNTIVDEGGNIGQYGIYSRPIATLVNPYIAKNTIINMATAAYGGSITGPTPSGQVSTYYWSGQVASANIVCLSQSCIVGGAGYGVSASGTATWAGGGCITPPVLNLTTNSAGAISTASVATPGSCQKQISVTAGIGSSAWVLGGGLSAGSGGFFQIAWSAVEQSITIPPGASGFHAWLSGGGGAGGGGAIVVTTNGSGGCGGGAGGTKYAYIPISMVHNNVLHTYLGAGGLEGLPATTAPGNGGAGGEGQQSTLGDNVNILLEGGWGGAGFGGQATDTNCSGGGGGAMLQGNDGLSAANASGGTGGGGTGNSGNLGGNASSIYAGGAGGGAAGAGPGKGGGQGAGGGGGGGGGGGVATGSPPTVYAGGNGGNETNAIGPTSFSWGGTGGAPNTNGAPGNQSTYVGTANPCGGGGGGGGAGESGTIAGNGGAGALCAGSGGGGDVVAGLGSQAGVGGMPGPGVVSLLWEF